MRALFKRRRTMEPPSEQWKSALCVTSLYDSYIQLQQENEQLKKQLQMLPLSKQQVAQQPETSSDVEEQLRHEICLLRAEKAQMNDLHGQRMQQMEKQLAEFKAKHAQQVQKYQQKFALDPQVSSRVALAGQTLRDTLERVVHEKEELALRYDALHQLYQQTKDDQQKGVQDLQNQLNRLQQDRNQQAKQRVAIVLERWVTTRLRQAWTKWEVNTMNHRLQQSGRESVDAIQQLHASRFERLRMNQVALVIGRKTQTLLWRIFQQWRRNSRHQAEIRGKVVCMLRGRIQLNVRSIFGQWRQVARKQARFSMASERIDKLVHSHQTRRAWKQWFHVTCTCHIIEAAQEQSNQLQQMLLESQTTIEHLKEKMASLELESLDVKNQLIAERNQHSIIVKRSHTAQLNLQQRLGTFFQKRTDNELRSKTLKHWYQLSRVLRIEKARIQNFRVFRFRITIQRKILAWHTQTKFQQRYRLVARNYVMRMKQIGVMRCFNAWKQDVNDRKERDTIKWRVICHLKHRQSRRMFSQWVEFKRQRQYSKNIIGNMAMNFQKMGMSVNFTRWRSTIENIQVGLKVTHEQELEQKWRTRLLETKQSLTCLRQVIAAWQNAVVYSKALRAMSANMLKRWKSGILARCIREWQDFMSSRKRVRIFVRRWVGNYSISALQRAWSRWQTHIMLEAHHDMFRAWKQEQLANKFQLEATIAECQQREQTLMTKYQESEKQRTREIQNLNDQLNGLAKQRRRYEHVATVLCLSKEHNQTLRKTFKAWQIRTEHMRIQQKRISLYQGKRQQKQVHLILRSWRWILARRARLINIMHLFQSYVYSHQIVQCFTAWQAFMANQKAIRVFSLIFDNKSEQQRRVFAFQSWRQESRKRSLLRKTIQRIWFHSIHEKLKSQFQQWVSITKALRVIEQNDSRAQTLLALQVKICAKWTSCGIRTIFSGWKRVTDRIKRQKEISGKFKLRHELVTTTLTFKAWKEIISLSQARRDFLIRHFAVYDDIRVKGAFQMWKMALLRWREHEINKLKCLNAAQQLSLAEQNQVLHTATHENAATTEELLQWRQRFDETSKTSQILSQRLILRHSYDEWKASTREKRLVKMQHRLFQTRRALQLTRHTFSAWKLMKCRRLAVLTAVNERHRGILNTRAQNCIREWKKHTHIQSGLKARLKIFARRRNLSTFRNRFKIWYSVVHRWRVLKDILPKIEVTISQTRVQFAFTLWKDDTSGKRAREILLRAKQKRLLEFMLDKDIACLDRILQSWKQLVIFKKAKRAYAADSYVKACLQTKRVAWQSWIQSVQRVKSQRNAIVSLQNTARVYYLRTALSSWKKHIYRDEINRLRELSERLSEQLATTNGLLGLKVDKVEQLNEDIADLASQLTDAKSTLSHVSANMELTAAAVEQECARSKALNRVLHMSLTHRGVSTAFGRWKMMYISDRMKIAACKRLGRIFSRRQRQFSFWTWKIHNIGLNRLRVLEHALRQRMVQRTLQGWNTFVSRRNKIKQFLLILASQLAPRETSSVRLAFLLWRRGNQVIYMENRVAQFATSLQLEKREANIVAKNFALARLCWQAYHHRLRQMQGFISHARTLSFQNTIKDLKHQLQAMEVAREQMSIEHQTNLKLASRKGENQVEKDATIKSIEEKYIAGSLFQALQTLFRRVTQATTMAELFTGISSASAQSLHGISGSYLNTCCCQLLNLITMVVVAVLFLFDPCTNELWTQREDSKIIQVPGSLGIAGYTLSTASSLLVIDAPADQRFHPMVDQFVLAGLRHGDRSLGASYTSYGLTGRKNDASISIFSSCLLSTDGTY